jgi:hypothetical protein
MDGKSITRQSAQRMLIAVAEGRKVGRKGPPPYLEPYEIEEFESEIKRQTLVYNSLRINEVALIV